MLYASKMEIVETKYITEFEKMPIIDILQIQTIKWKQMCIIIQ
ncbi:unnamed protein product [Paramecium sonneborni]|uniref:Uncharacterized protein n=1 Tax=Paramecium sonneborni TaxID=65129 RepID=A0A8S1LHB9_9CILI|nr:unnamed protein product [Paramecium sonneborni]CAD8065935.1 unnamed protein product [Paramecium sonneborni]